MWPSLTAQPRCLANWITSPSELRNRRDFVELMGRLGYAHAVFVAGHLAALHGLPHSVVAALHQPSLQLDGITKIAIALHIASATPTVSVGEALELRVELCVTTLRQEKEQAQACDLVALGKVGGQSCGRQLVKGLELLDIAGEGIWVPGADGEEGTLLVRLSGEGQEIGRG
ncbi:hypothetical protein TOPH_04475 [Tolypocladium ophioglossoides CBS 100239]|uniref:Uncharacterized protein n=1 Tax=Tolypocladium ophioglossoides (strain CBS 100239) TaxID=1163406 RepID=A0A0L0NA05_TOLOC|nr:hypothetical protein TOPH_04475 [Tolypocladium ophioglossoides CBS 100239]